MSLVLSGMFNPVYGTMKVKLVGSGNPAIFCSNECAGFASVSKDVGYVEKDAKY